MTTRNLPRSEIEKLLGVHRTRVDQWVTAGAPCDQVPWKNGTAKKFNLAELFAWVVNFERTKAGAANIEEFKDQRERLAAAQAEKTELQVAELRGTLVPIESVERGWSITWSTVRDLLRAIPMSAVDRCLAAAEDGRASLKDALQAEIDEGLERASRVEVVIQPYEDDREQAA